MKAYSSARVNIHVVLFFSSEKNYLLFNAAASTTSLAADHDEEETRKYKYFAIPKGIYQGSLQKKWKQFILIQIRSHSKSKLT